VRREEERAEEETETRSVWLAPQEEPVQMVEEWEGQEEQEEQEASSETRGTQSIANR
jgi:hypothetical protein